MQFSFFAALAAGLLSGTASAARLGPESSVLICHDVRDASRIQSVSAVDVQASVNMALEAMETKQCFEYGGSARWKLVEENYTYGYGKVTYDTDTKRPKIGYIPWFYGYSMGLSKE